MWKVAISSLWAHKRRLVGTSSAVLLGVAFLASTLVIGDSVRTGFDRLFTQANAGTDVVVRAESKVGNEASAQRRALDDTLVDEVADVDGVGTAVGSIEGIAQIIGSDGETVGMDGPPTLAGDWITDPDLNPWRIAEGRAPQVPGEVVIDRGSAEDGDLAVGTATTVNVPRPIEVEVVGIATYGDADSMGPTTYTAFTREDAERYFLTGPGQVSRVLVHAESGVEQEELAGRVASVLPDDVEALTGAELTSEMNADIEADFLGIFETFLLVFAGVALLVATFSIYNTFSIIVAQRTRESALLRAIGASRRQILASMGVEALALGIVASVLGFALGIGLAYGLLALMDAVGFAMPNDGLVIATRSAAVAIAVGVVVTLLASLIPTVKASRVAPMAALRDASLDRTHASVPRMVLGLVLTLAGVGLVLSGAFGDGSGLLTRAGLGAVLTLTGFVVLGPFAARVGSAVLGAPLRVSRGMTGSLARQNAMRNPRRTASTASALMIGVGIVVLFTVFAASIKTWMDDTVSRSVTADLVVTSPSFGGSGVSPQLADDVAALPEVEASSGLGLGALLVDGDDRQVTVSDPAALAAVFDAEVSDGSLAALSGDQIAVSSEAADEKGWGVGDAVQLEYVDGATETATIGAVYERTEFLGNVVVPTAAYAPHTAQLTNEFVFVRLADGVTLADGRAAVETIAEGFGSPPVEDRAQFVETTSSQIDMILNVIYAMLGLAIIIALMGIANTLALSIHERTRELGLLRAVGQLRSQLRAMVRWESVVIALFGTIGGVGLGVFLGWAVVRAITTEEGVGAFTLPTGQLVVILVVGAFAGVLAGIRPAWRAAKLDVLDAITTE